MPLTKSPTGTASSRKVSAQERRLSFALEYDNADLSKRASKRASKLSKDWQNSSKTVSTFQTRGDGSCDQHFDEEFLEDEAYPYNGSEEETIQLYTNFRDNKKTTAKKPSQRLHNHRNMYEERRTKNLFSKKGELEQPYPYSPKDINQYRETVPRHLSHIGATPSIVEGVHRDLRKAELGGYVSKDNKAVDIFYRGRGGKITKWDGTIPEEDEQAVKREQKTDNSRGTNTQESWL